MNIFGQDVPEPDHANGPTREWLGWAVAEIEPTGRPTFDAFQLNAVREFLERQVT